MTVEDYFRFIKGRTLLYPRLPGVKHKGAVYPFELCKVIPGQFYKKTPPPDLVTKCVEMTMMRPSRRIEEIRKRFKVYTIVFTRYILCSIYIAVPGLRQL